LRQRLPDYMVPSAFVVLPALPQTPNGKIDRSALPAPDARHLAAGATFVAPRDALERSLAALFREELGTRGPIGVHDDFFALGGHSLLAVRLFARIQREHGADLPLAILFEAPSVAQLAERLRAARTQPSVSSAAPAPAPKFEFLVPIASQGARPPLFCVHGAGGNVLGLTPLGRQLAQHGHSVYALQARGVDGTSSPFARIEDAATAYLGELKAVQPEGPYRLAGYCGGGVIAFEMARQLRAAGERVELLTLIDTYRPGVEPSRDRLERVRTRYRRGGGGALVERLLGRLRHALWLWLTLLWIAGHRLGGVRVPLALRDLWLTHAFFRAAARYTPVPQDVRLVVLRAREVDEGLLGVERELGWSALARDGVEVHDVPGGHRTLLDEPNAAVVAGVLLACLARIQGPAQPR
jgi:aspartate racemase